VCAFNMNKHFLFCFVTGLITCLSGYALGFPMAKAGSGKVSCSKEDQREKPLGLSKYQIVVQEGTLYPSTDPFIKMTILLDTLERFVEDSDSNKDGLDPANFRRVSVPTTP